MTGESDETSLETNGRRIRKLLYEKGRGGQKSYQVTIRIRENVKRKAIKWPRVISASSASKTVKPRAELS